MEVNPNLAEIVQAYNDCLKQMMYINEMALPGLIRKQPCCEEKKEEVVDPEQYGDMCYDCVMQNFGLTLLQAIKSHFPSHHSNIKPESLKDGETQDPYALIELMMYQAQERDKMNRDLMEEVASLRQEKNKLMCEVNEKINEIVNLKKSVDLIKNNKLCNRDSRMPF